MNKILQYFPDEFVDKKSGKIKIPQHVKRVRLDVGVSENAPMSREWIAEDRAGELLIFGFEPHPESRRILREGTSVWPNPIQPQEVGKRLMQPELAMRNKAIITPKMLYVFMIMQELMATLKLGKLG